MSTTVRLRLSQPATTSSGASPPLLGWAVAGLAPAVLLGIDALGKRHRP